jgi:hypothetical protein
MGTSTYAYGSTAKQTTYSQVPSSASVPEAMMRSSRVGGGCGLGGYGIKN